MLRFLPTLFAPLLLATALPVIADDTVVIASGKDGKGRTKLSGTVFDYTGKELRLRKGAGRESVVPAEKVVSVETTKEAKHVAADGLFDSGDYVKAAEAYREAMRDEKRGWVQRQILTQTIWCFRNQGQIERAGDMFLILIENDPATQYFDAIPLCWTATQPPAGALQKARAWLAKESASPAMLLGASWLLSTERAAAIAALERLKSDADPRVGQLAEAQLWRVKIVTAKQADVARWQTAVERLPAPLRAGPYYLLGEALARQEQHAQAAAAYLRVPLLYPLHAYLAPDALFAAGRELESLGQSGEAANVYRELTTDYPAAPRAAEAQRRLEGLSRSPLAE